MPKLKSNRSVRRRFRVTPTGKILRRRAGKSHLLTLKPRSVKRAKHASAFVSGVDREKILKILPYGST